MNKLREYLNSLPVDEQHKFARRVGTSVGYMRKAISTNQRLGVGLLVEIERATDGAVRCEDLRPDVDWSVIRGTATQDNAGVAA